MTLETESCNGFPVAVVSNYYGWLNRPAVDQHHRFGWHLSADDQTTVVASQRCGLLDVLRRPTLWLFMWTTDMSGRRLHVFYESVSYRYSENT